MSNHIETRAKLKKIRLAKDFEKILESCTLSKEDKEMLRRHYIERQTFAFIGDCLGYSEREMIKMHKEALEKIAAVI